MTRFIGIDLHTTQLTICYRDIEGNEQIEIIKIDLVDKLLKKLTPDDKVAFEATGNSLFLYRKLSQVIATEDITVVNTSRFKLISKSVKKTDKNDAKILAEYLSKDMLPKAKLKDEIDSQVYALIETRDNLVKMTTAFKNQIHNIFVKQGIKLKAKDVSNANNLNRLITEYEFDEVTMFHIKYGGGIFLN